MTTSKRNLLLSSAVALAAAVDAGSAKRAAPAKGSAPPPKVKDVSADKSHATARQIADQIAEDEGALSWIDSTIDAKETQAVSPVNLYLAFVDVLGKDVLNGTPIPGTPMKYKDADGVEHIVNNPDQYEASKEGTTGTVKRYFWNDVADGLPQGKRINDALAAATEKKKTDERAYQLDKAKYEAQRSTLRRLVKQAGGLHHQITAVGGYEGAEFDWVREEDGSIARTNKPITVESTTDRKKFAYFTVQQFLSLDVQEASTTDNPESKAKAGSYARLMETSNRGGNQGGGGDEDAIEDFDEFSARAATLLNWLETDSGHTTVQRRVKKMDTALIHTLDTIHILLDGILAEVPAQTLKELRVMHASAKNVRKTGTEG